MKAQSELQSYVNLAVHHLKRGNDAQRSQYSMRIGQLLQKTAVPRNVLLDPVFLQALMVLGYHAELAEALKLEPGLRVSSPELQYLYGELVLRCGQIREALDIWKTVPSTWNNSLLRIRTNQLLQYPEMVLGNALLPEREPRVHVIVLTRNRERYLRVTLDRLKRTEYSNYRVFIVDNASTDATPALLRETAASFVPGVEVAVQSLPTNIGRPAGHNWLLTNWDHSEADYIAILDDDLLDFPSNWMRLFVNTFTLKSDIAAVGGKTLGSDLLIQDATAVIRPPSAEGYMGFFTNRGEGDWGQFNYISNVTDYIIGCASMFKREVFQTAGLFDIRFSPSQGVDIEHGLRIRQHGFDLLYNGNCTFVHAQLTSENLESDRPRLGNSLGNFLKLNYMYTPDKYTAIMASCAAREQAFLKSGGIF